MKISKKKNMRISGILAILMVLSLLVTYIPTVPVFANEVTNGSSVLAAEVPVLSVSSDLYGSLYTTGKSTNKAMFGQVVEYDPNSKATLTLTMDGLNDDLIDSSNAVVSLVDGDGYYSSEYILKATELAGDWENGKLEYKLTTGDIEINTEDYLILDTNSGREWSCLGGDGHGNYWFNLSVSGITYDGISVAPQTFRAHIYVYSFNYSEDATSLYGANGTPAITPVSKPLDNPPVVTTIPTWTWVGVGEKPILCDNKADDFYVTWQTDSTSTASGLIASDFTVTLKSNYGDQKVLIPGRDYVINYDSSKNTTLIALIYQNWAFIPVYNKMDIDVIVGGSSYTNTFDIASVYVYEAQQGGGGTTVDGTVTAYSFYGLKNLADVSQILANATFTLRTTVEGTQKYYTETGGSAVLTDSAASAMTFDANGSAERNLRLIGNTAYITTRQNKIEKKTVNGVEYTFTKVYSGGGLLNPMTCDQSLIADDGYVIPRGEANWITANNWITNEKWAWQKGVELGYTGVEVQPHGARYGQNLAQGTGTQFTATINDVDEAVNWTIVGVQPSSGTTLSSTGFLSISAKEPAGTKFSVHAVSKADGFLKGAVEITVTAAPADTFTVTFYLNGGQSTGGGALTQQVSSGGAAVAPAVIRSGYTFKGWDKAFSNVTADMTITAQWTANSSSGRGVVVNSTQPEAAQPEKTQEVALTTQTAIKLTIGNVNYTVGETVKTMDVAPFIQDGRTMVPVRFVAEALGAIVDWDGDTRTVTIVYRGKTLTLIIGSLIPGMDVAPYIKDGRTFVQTRYIMEYFGAEVDWVETTQTVVITTK